MIISWATTGPAVTAAFLASLVEVVEAFTIVLAVSTVRGWRPALIGTGCGLALLAVLIATLGPLLDRVPIHVLQLVIGVLLLLFGLRWLRKAILRTAGILAVHDEASAYARQEATLRGAGEHQDAHLKWIAGLTAFKAVVLEGLEVVFIVIAVGAGRGLPVPAALGAFAACALVLLLGVLIHKPLARVPENTLKFGVAIMLSAFGIFWTGEGLGIDWPGQDLAILTFIAIFLAYGVASVAVLRRSVSRETAQ
jgi:uncharacterized membrane protein